MIRVPRRLARFASAPKRFKIAIGGRGSGKSESCGQMVPGMVAQAGCRAVCAREFQSSIKQSVHSLIARKIRECEFDGFEVRESDIRHENGGQINYIGLQRDPEGIKSYDEAQICWVEEAQTLSSKSLELLTPSIRGTDGEIWMTANLGRSTDPFSQRFIKPFERQLRDHREYEDDLHLIIWVNYDENPWFPRALELERQYDEQVLPTAAYAHKWLGEFGDSVQNSIIDPEWFDACVDAHKALGIAIGGIHVASHDPADTGQDAKSVCLRQGILIKDVMGQSAGNVNDGCDWATGYAIRHNSDVFIWDGDGMGAGLQRQVDQAFATYATHTHMYRGSGAVDKPHAKYVQPGSVGNASKGKTNREMFKNRRAQRYWSLRDRIWATYRAVKHGEYCDPDSLISFSSDIEQIDLLRSEIGSIYLVDNPSGYIQIASKKEMRMKGIMSPNMADAVKMSFDILSLADNGTRPSDEDENERPLPSGWMR